MKSITILFFLITVSLTTASGEGHTPNELFRSLSKNHLEKIIGAGIYRINNLDLKKMVEELNQVEWRTFDIGFLIGSGGQRTTSIYMTEDKMVVVNVLYLQNLVGKPVPMYSWALHEGLGALGYDDENYQLSSAISFFANSLSIDDQYQPLLVEIKDSLPREELPKSTENMISKTNGGVTIVGGGGDAVLIELKQKLLARYWEKSKLKANGNVLAYNMLDKIIKLKMEYDVAGNDYNNSSFVVQEDTLLMGLGGMFLLGKIFSEEYVDKILNSLNE